MLTYILKRIGSTSVTMLAVSVIIFALTQVLGDEVHRHARLACPGGRRDQRMRTLHVGRAKGKRVQRRLLVRAVTGAVARDFRFFI